MSTLRAGRCGDAGLEGGSAAGQAAGQRSLGQPCERMGERGVLSSGEDIRTTLSTHATWDCISTRVGSAEVAGLAAMRPQVALVLTSLTGSANVMVTSGRLAHGRRQPPHPTRSCRTGPRRMLHAVPTHLLSCRRVAPGSCFRCFSTARSSWPCESSRASRVTESGWTIGAQGRGGRTHKELMARRPGGGEPAMGDGRRGLELTPI